MGSKFKLAVIDLETDPFKHGRMPLPFAAGFFDGDTYFQTWGDNCVEEMMQFLEAYPVPLRIYAHNGGKFDFWFMQRWIDNPLMFIKSRLVKGMLCGRHEIRDSFSILPVPLRDYKKDETDYATFEYGVRERHKKSISLYLQHDCEYLYDLVSQFVDEFGASLTIGSSALKELKKLHPQGHQSRWHDAEFRPYYFGGRVECFRHGLQTGNFKFYDVNSMYPFVMRDYEHPIGDEYFYSKRLPDSGFYFADITCDSMGALPVRGKSGGLSFPHGTYRFLACSHEIQTALENGLIKNVKVHAVNRARKTQNFAAFVEKFSARKIQYEVEGNKAMRLFMKLVLNSAYGKFATDPTQFKDTLLYEDIQTLLDDGCEYAGMFGTRFLGERLTEIRSYSYHDVAVAASITSAARSVLLHGLSRARHAIYCDTDSIVAEDLDMPLHETALGAFKNEASADEVYIGGKKMYAAFSESQQYDDKGKPLPPTLYEDGMPWWGVKKASKGVQLSYQDIVKVAMGETILSEIEAPNLRLGKSAKFIARTIAMTR